MIVESFVVVLLCVLFVVGYWIMKIVIFVLLVVKGVLMCGDVVCVYFDIDV